MRPSAGAADYPIFMAVAEKVGFDRRGNTLYKRSAEGAEITQHVEQIETITVGWAQGGAHAPPQGTNPRQRFAGDREAVSGLSSRAPGARSVKGRQGAI